VDVATARHDPPIISGRDRGVLEIPPLELLVDCLPALAGEDTVDDTREMRRTPEVISVRGEHDLLAPNADYFGGSPHLSRVVYRIFAGERWEAVYEEFQRGNLEDAPVPSRDYRRVVSSGGHIY